MKKMIAVLLVLLLCLSFLLSTVQGAGEIPDYLKKLDSYLLEYMADKQDDELIPISIRLKYPSDAEIEEMISVPVPDDSSTAEEIETYFSARRTAQQEVYSAITAAFAEEHLDDNDEILFRGKFMPNVKVKVPKSKIVVLAALDEVTNIGYTDDKAPVAPAGSGNLEPPTEPDYLKKLDSYLLEYMADKQDDELIPISIRLKYPSDAEIEEMISVPVPDDSSTSEEIEAYFSARRTAQQEVYSAITAAFAEEHLDDNDEILFRGKFMPNVKVKVPKSKIAVLAALDEVTNIGYTDDKAPVEPAESGDSEAPGEDELGNFILTEVKFVMKKNIEYAEKLDRTKYTDESLAILDAALTAAKAAMDSDDTVEVEAADAALQEALGVLEKRPDKSDLEAAIEEAKAIDFSLYTEETVAALREVIAVAEAVLAKENASPEEIEAAVRALSDFNGNIINEDPFRFDDVNDEGKFYFEPVYWAVDQKITNGTGEKLFSPDASCTRGQVVTFLWRAAGEPEPEKSENPFTDVKEGAFYYTAVLWAVETGVTKGATETTFAPDAVCTRGQIVTFLYRANGSPEIAPKDNPFKDVADGQYFADAVKWAVANEITKGKSADTFSPDATCTRGEVVTFLYRAA